MRRFNAEELQATLRFEVTREMGQMGNISAKARPLTKGQVNWPLVAICSLLTISDDTAPT